MSVFLENYFLAFMAGVMAIVVAGGGLLFGRLLRPSRPSVVKQAPYESGAEPVGTGWSQSHLRYYLYALLFVIFDIEIAFIVPWAVQVEALGLYGLMEMLIFLVILGLGLAYAWRKKVLTWDS